MPPLELLDEIFRQRLGAGELLFERLAAEFADVAIGIVLLGQEQERGLLAVGQRGQSVLESAPGRALAGGIAVEREDDPLCLPEQFLDVLSRCGRAERGHRISDAVLRQRHDIHVALDDDHHPCVADRLPGLEQAIELASLHEQRRLGGVEVFRLARVDHATPETDVAALRIGYRKDDPVAEAVVALAALADDHQPHGFQRLVFVIGDCFFEVLPAVGGKPQSKARRDLAREAPALQISDRARRRLQLVLVVGCRDVEQVGEVRQLVATRTQRFAVAGLRNRQPDLLSQLLDGFREGHSRMLDQEADRGAVCAAAEAVIELLGRGDGERR